MQESYIGKVLSSETSRCALGSYRRLPDVLGGHQRLPNAIGKTSETFGYPRDGIGDFPMFLGMASGTSRCPREAIGYFPISLARTSGSARCPRDGIGDFPMSFGRASAFPDSPILQAAASTKFRVKGQSNRRSKYANRKLTEW